MEKFRIYCDMDGVVADFIAYTTNILGHKFTDDDWDDLPVDMFLQLPPMPDARVLWGYIKQEFAQMIYLYSINLPYI